MAIQLYRKALDHLDHRVGEMLTPKKEDISPEDLQEILEDRIKTHNNLAIAQMKVSAWEAALKSVDTVLACKPDNVKALFRKGMILEKKGQVNDAIPLLQRAATLDPENRAIQNVRTQISLSSYKEMSKLFDFFAVGNIFFTNFFSNIALTHENSTQLKMLG